MTACGAVGALMADIDYVKLRELAQAATPGPWRALGTGPAGGDHWYVCDDGESIASIHANDGSDEDQRQPDAEYIAAVSPDVVLTLLDELDNTRRILASVDTALVWEYADESFDVDVEL